MPLSAPSQSIFARKETLAGARLPYAYHVNDKTIATRDGMLCQMIHIEGLPFETADTEELNYRHTIRETVLRATASPNIGLYHHILRRPVDIHFGATPEDAFSAELDGAWKKKLETKRMFVNELFLVIMHRPLRGRHGLLESAANFIGRQKSNGAVEIARAQRDLDSACDAMVSSLQAYGARQLTAYQTPSGSCSELLEFLSFLYNAELRPVLLPNSDLGHYIPFKRVSFGGNVIDLQGATDQSRRFSAMISVKDYPATTSPGLLDNLLRLPFEMVVSQSFGFVDRQVALDRMNLALRRMRAADDDALSLRADLTVAKDNVAAGRSHFGEHHLSVQVRVEKPETLDDAVSHIISSFTDLGIIAVREDINLEPSFWAQFPGNFKDIARRALISTSNFASLSSLHNFPIGSAHGNHWGDAITVLETTSGTPYYFNFHKGDLGNFTVIGPSGSGKTVVLTFLLSQARKIKPRIIYFDKDRGAELFIRAIGGRYSVLRPGHSTGFNPLLLSDTNINRRFLNDWLSCLLSVHGDELDAEDRERIDAAVDANFEQEPYYRRLRFLRELLAGSARPTAGDLSHRLSAWCGDGERAWLFDDEKDKLDLSGESIGFDMTQILDDPASRVPVMMYLFHRVEERLDGTPTVIVVDEGWKALDDETFVMRIKDWEKTIRKRNGILGFCTQNARDALDSRIGPAIIEQSATQIFMPNPKAQAADYCSGFGLTNHELDLIRNLPDTSHCFLIKHGKDSVIARLDLSGLDNMLTILSGREETVRRFDQIRAQEGDKPDLWRALLS